MTKKVITPTSGTAQTIYYETNDDNTVVKFSAGGRTVTSHSKTDSFGRKVFDELQLGTDFVSRQFVYHAGKVTAEHKTNAKVKSSATTQLVSQIILSNGTTLSYGYDAEDRITSVVETYTVDDTPVTNTTIYTYDALGQLLTETVNGEVVNTMKYDNYGNIVEKNGKDYSYGNATWKDLLTSYNGQTITYDAQGNPLTYLGHTLEWEKGRQLKKFDNIEYTYNANGIRTSKIVNGIKHEYTLDGTKILRETWDGNTLIPLYDNEDSVCGIIHNDTPYYFIKNLQGDVIAIVDNDAQTVARYAYDAWGECTVTQDSVGIATINPFRYRGYYYDEEIKFYYLQSRYYDASVGRLINADEVKTLPCITSISIYNLFCYCENNPSNETDESGAMIAKKIAEVILSAVFGMLFQLFIDFAVYMVRKLVNKDNTNFTVKPVDYVDQALSWALSTFNPFSKKRRILAEFIITLIVSILKQVENLVRGKKFEMAMFFTDVAVATVKAAIKSIMSRSTKKTISKLKKKHFKNARALRNKKMELRSKFEAFGKKIDLCLDIPTGVVDFVIRVLE